MKKGSICLNECNGKLMKDLKFLKAMVKFWFLMQNIVISRETHKQNVKMHNVVLSSESICLNILYNCIDDDYIV